jgi:branched-chain amino acid transport system permease protein
VGVIFMLLLPEALRFVGLPDAIAHNIREIIYGLLLAALMYLRPRGLAGEFKMA